MLLVFFSWLDMRFCIYNEQDDYIDIGHNGDIKFPLSSSLYVLLLSGLMVELIR